MSWQQWQPPTQPAMPAIMNATAAAMPMGLQYTTEQWQQMQQQNWQQWAQWQQQYQQWHQQYGAEYQKSLSAMANMGALAPPINTSAPPPLPADAKPPPPPDEPAHKASQPVTEVLTAKQPPQQQAASYPKNTNTSVNVGYNSVPIDVKMNPEQSNWRANQVQSAYPGNYGTVPSAAKPSTDLQKPIQANTLPNTNVPPGAKRTSTASMETPEAKKHKVEWSSEKEQDEDVSDPEKKFMKQFAEWEAQFNKWKEQNQDHPDKAQYREYEKKWEAWRNQLLERRELMRKKRLGMAPGAALGPGMNVDGRPNIRPTPAPVSKPTFPVNDQGFKTEYNSSATHPQTAEPNAANPMQTNSSSLSTLFKSNNDGIPGLDLVDAPAQPDRDLPQPKVEESKADLNLEALSKNINSILGDQKLLSMLSLVAQSTTNPMNEPPPKREQEIQPQQQPAVVNPIQMQTQNTRPPSIAPSQGSAYDESTNWSGSAKSNSFNNWNNNDFRPNYPERNTNYKSDFEYGQHMNKAPPMHIPSNYEGDPSNFSSMPPKMQMHPPSIQKNNNYSTGNGDYNNQGREMPMHYNDGRNDRYPMDERDMNNYDGFGEHQGDSWGGNEPDHMAPAPPTITDFEDILKIDKVIDYEHKGQKQDTVDVKLIPPRLFDYRHKLVTRIPLPERPKWLSNAFHNIPEFAPPISSRPTPQLSRYATSYPQPTPPSRRRFDDYNTFSRRPPSHTPYNNSEPPSRDRPFEEAVDHRSKSDGFSSANRRPWSKDSRDSTSRLSENKDRWNDFDSRKSRDHSWDPSTNSKDNKDFRPVYKVGGTLGLDRNPQIGNTQIGKTINKCSVDDLLNQPGRSSRPPRIVIILRGPPGSGKTFLAKQIKDKEAENGGSAPRILSLDDYFMVEQEKEVVEDGKTVKVKEMVYEYEECMEATYRHSLLKTFKKTVTDGYFSFIIVDNVNDKVKYFEEMWQFAKQNGFQVYICQLELDVPMCTKRNIHGRSEVEIQHIVSGWEETPMHYLLLDATNLIQAGAIPEVEMEEINSPNDDFGDDDEDDENERLQSAIPNKLKYRDILQEQACNSSKWDNFECSIDNLAKLDGINKPLRSAGTMEDYLQLEEWTVNTRALQPGQKRVRWADLEERKEQEKMRAIGFVVGQTNWERMMDPTQGGSALTQTKYIERVGVRKVNMN